MRNVLRLSLFIVARLGLFVALAGWIAGQWWFVDFRVSVFDHNIVVSALPADWCVTRIPTGPQKFFWSAHLERILESGDGDTAVNVSPIQRRASLFEWIVLSGHPKPPNLTSKTSSRHLAGISYFECRAVESIFVPHFIVVAFFAGFYGILKWVYRKAGIESSE